jgi:hypothetical protein
MDGLLVQTVASEVYSEVLVCCWKINFSTADYDEKDTSLCRVRGPTHLNNQLQLLVKCREKVYLFYVFLTTAITR